MAADRLQQALEIAFGFLAKRDRTVAETARRLESEAVDPAVARQALAALIEQGYLDDARYARRFTEDRRSLDGWGCRRIEQRLVGAGVDAELAQATVQRPHDVELEAAVALLRRRLPHGADQARERDRALGLLLRRGYDFELACDAVREHSRTGRVA
ncbi:MAG: regulatory protein RecX [Solirubrobacteraceae bacterium]